jgi:hypothetical protein
MKSFKSRSVSLELLEVLAAPDPLVFIGLSAFTSTAHQTESEAKRLPAPITDIVFPLIFTAVSEPPVAPARPTQPH